MGEYIITTDNGADIQEKLINEYEINQVYLPVIVDGKEYDGEKNKLSFKDLCQFMKRGVIPKTSQVNLKQMIDFFKKFLDKGLDIIHISIGSNVSGSYNSCKMAANELKEQYPDRKIEIIDSMSGSMGEGSLVIYGNLAKRAGKNISETLKEIKTRRNCLEQVFTLNDLKYLQYSGRLKKTSRIIGSIMGIKPILGLNNQKQIVLLTTCRGRQHSLEKLVDEMVKNIDIYKNKFISITHTMCEKEAEKVRQMIRNRTGIKNILIGEMGPMIGSHSGSEAIAVFYIGFLNNCKNQ